MLQNDSDYDDEKGLISDDDDGRLFVDYVDDEDDEESVLLNGRNNNHNNNTNNNNKNVSYRMLDGIGNAHSFNWKKHPLDSPNCCLRLWHNLTTSWVFTLVDLGRKRPITISDLYALPHQESLSFAMDQWNKLDAKLKSKNDGKDISILRIMWEIEKSEILFVLLMNTLRALVIVGLLYLWQFLIAFYTDTDVSVYDGCLLAVYLLILNVIRSCANTMIDSTCSSMGSRMMTMIMAVMYDFGLEMDLQCSNQQASLNIIGSNMEYIGWGLLYLPSSMIFAIILLIASLLFTWVVVGHSAIVGIVFVLFVGLPTQLYIGLSISSADDDRYEISDRRVEFINDLFSGMKFTKLYAWEIPLMKRISLFRKREKKYVKKYHSSLAYLRMCNYLIPTFFLVSIVTYYVLVLGHKLHLYLMFQLIITNTILASAIQMIPIHSLFACEFMFAVQRIDEFLNSKKKPKMMIDTDPIDEDVAIKLSDTSFTWDYDSDNRGNDDSNTFKLTNVSMCAKKGKLIAVIGEVGSGKSSLLQAILGEMRMLKGRYYVADGGGLCFVDQTAFILHGTLRDNILMGLEYDECKYAKVIKYSALAKDISILPNGDSTEIGEKGVTLSGGQKMRISFARALYRYAQSEIYILDDPLSCVDIDVGSILFKKGILKLLKHKTRIVIMNSHLFYLKYFDQIYILQKNEETNQSTIAVKASYKELISNDKYAKYRHLILENDNCNMSGVNVNDDDDDSESDGDTESGDKPNRHTNWTQEKGVCLNNNNAISEQKEYFTGFVEMDVYREYLNCAIDGSFDSESAWFKDSSHKNNLRNNLETRRSNILYLSLTLLLLCISYLCDPLSDIYLVLWAKNDNASETGNVLMFLAIWIIMISVIGLLRLYSGILAANWLTKAAFNLFTRTLYFTMRSPISYFHSTPKGKILNRFTKDANIIDIDIPFDFDLFASESLTAISYLLVVCILIPPMIVMLLLVFPAFYFLVSSYRATYIELVRLSISNLDPITSIFSETLGGNGLNSIRAYKLQSFFRRLLHARIVLFVNVWSARNAVYAWFDCYLDLLIDLVVFLATILGFYARDSYDSSYAPLIAFAIVYLNIITGHLQVSMLQLVWLESEFGAVKRLLWYHPKQHNIVYEANARNHNYQLDCNSQWPMKGDFLINNLRLKYNENSPNYVLDIKQMTIAHGEKIGICGRTGAGKSSLMVALFRLIEPENGCSIVVDGRQCMRLGLYDLRKNMTIIPQDPILFMGTLRFNLDPFNKYCDKQLWTVLKMCKLDKLIAKREAQLNCKIQQNGSNFSQGQKQLICIARALLKDTKCLLLDEATSSIDKHTDCIIQSLIRKHFKDTTVLCIAHRLETIMDYDRIAVLDHGKVVQFDKPTNLINDANGAFAKMINKAL